jgi:peptidoglycan/LPS O-acetylase OafA/YrhL
MVVFPLMILIGASSPPGARSVSTFTFLGVTSYAVYVFHEPVFHLIRTGTLKVLHLDLQGFDPWLGFAFLAACCCSAGWSTNILTFRLGAG